MSANSIRLFDTWAADYGAAVVTFYKPGTTTKASIFSDVSLNNAASNPQTLLAKTVNGVTFGKFAAPIYIDEAYYIDIGSTDRTGVIYPTITNFKQQDVSLSRALVKDATITRALEDHFAQFIHAEDYGAMVPSDAPSAAANTTTLAAAIGAASANSGGVVLLPPDNYTVNSFSLPANVILRGHGENVTVLTNQQAASFITLSGDGAGLERMTLDGVNKVASGVAVFTIGIDRSRFDEVKVKRFDTGLHFRGGRHSKWYDLTLSDNNTGAKLHGDFDELGGKLGDQWSHNSWIGGTVELNVNIGIDLSFFDRPVMFNSFSRILFDANLDKTININGAQFTTFDRPRFSANLKNFDVADDSDTSFNPSNTVIGLRVKDGGINAGQINITGKARNIVFDTVNIVGVAWTLTLPGNQIVLVDCPSDITTTIAGQATRLSNITRINDGIIVGTTSDATPLTAWSLDLEPGQGVVVEAKVIANQKEDAKTAFYHTAHFAHRPGSTLLYDAQTADFTPGEVLTGSTSGATALIMVDVDTGASGTLTIRDIDGVFQNNETITDPQGGSATSDGTVTDNDAVLKGAQVVLMTFIEDVVAWDVTFAVTGGEVEVIVTGAASDTIEWTLEIKVVKD